MRNKCKRLLGSLVTASMVLACTASPGLAGTHVSGMALCWGDWRFKPIYNDNGGGVHVDGFLALAKSEAVTGDNIVAVWYIRDPGEASGWTTKSWLTTSVKEAVWSVKLGTGITDAEDENWELDEPLGVLAAPPEAPKDYDKGVLTMDPVYPVIATSEDPAGLVSLLATIGYKVADVAVDKGAGCTSSSQLNVMAVAFEAGIAMPVTDELSAAAQSETTNSALTPVFACQIDANAAATTFSNETVWSCGSHSDWVGPSNPSGTGDCNYRRSRTCTKTRTATKPGPPVSTVTQTKTKIEYESCSGTRNPNGSCPPPGTVCGNGAFTPGSEVVGPWTPRVD